MDDPLCLICHSARQRIHTIPVAELVSQYRRQQKLEVAAEFGGVRELHIARCPCCDFISFVPGVVGTERFYDGLQGHAWYYLADKAEFATARRFLRPGDRILDVGCGNGAFAQGHPAENYLGLEYTAGAIAMAESRGLTVRRQGVEAYAASRPEPHDMVCAFQVLEHVADQRAFIAACAEVCRPGGRVIFSTPNADSFANAASNLVLNFPPHHTAWFSRRFWLNLPQYFPLRLVEIIEEPLEPVHLSFYANTLVRASLVKWLGLRPPAPIDDSLRTRILGRLTLGLGAILARGLADERLRPKGQAITAVYERC
jgi:SAM-dependent methyltransferase